MELCEKKKGEARFSGVTGRGSNAQTGGASSLSVQPTANITVGKIAIVQAVSDNDDTVGGATTFHTLSDTDNNTWARVYEVTDTDGAADDGSTTSLWWTKVATQIDTTDSITVTYGGGSGSLTDATIAVFEATISPGNTITFVTSAATQTQVINMSPTPTTLPQPANSGKNSTQSGPLEPEISQTP